MCCDLARGPLSRAVAHNNDQLVGHVAALVLLGQMSRRVKPRVIQFSSFRPSEYLLTLQ